jgi:tetratricopeptide (TPR) repeat protein
MRILIFASLLFIFAEGISQPNCNIYKWNNNEPCYQACNLVNEDNSPQGSRQSQLLFDKALAMCPALDYALSEKAVPYLKRGDFITWKKLIEKAVELNPTSHLGYRGWCRFQFVRDYKGAIADLEKLSTLLSPEIGYSVNGDYQLNIAKALCYKAIGEKTKAIKIIEEQLATKNYSPGLYDYLHLGVLKIETGNIQEGIKYLNKSIAYNDYMAEPYYYLGLAYKSQNMMKEFKANMEKAKEYYQKGYKRFDPYTNPIDKIFLSDIERELKNIE